MPGSGRPSWNAAAPISNCASTDKGDWAMTLEQEVEQFWRKDYASGFMEKDAEKYASAFALPCLIRAEDSPRTVFRTREELVAHCALMIRNAQNTSWDTSSIDSL